MRGYEKACGYGWQHGTNLKGEDDTSSGAEGEEDGNDQMDTGNNVNTILEIHLNQCYLLNSCRVLSFKITPTARHYCHQHHHSSQKRLQGVKCTIVIRSCLSLF